MRLVILLGFISTLCLNAKENSVPIKVKKHYYNIATRIEEHVLEDYEYYMTSIIKSSDLQSILNADEKLFLLLHKPDLLENDLIKQGKSIVQKINESRIEKMMNLPETIPKSRITKYYFSSIN
ncbi:MAG: hypothetical protein ACE5D0_09680 [Fidelibacterota bacterium]